MAGLDLSYGDVSPSGRLVTKLAGVLRPDPASLTEWKQAFDLFSRKYPARRISRVLSWYCKHFTERGVPVVTSAKSFCRLFSELETLMGVTRPDPAWVGDLADELLDTYAWPYGADRFVAPAVRNSYRNYEKFLKRLYEIRPALDEFDRRLLNYLFDAIFYDARDFLPLWFEDASRELCSWKNFRPSESWLTLTPDSPRLERLACTHAYDWCCDSSPWFRIHRTLGSLAACG